MNANTYRAKRCAQVLRYYGTDSADSGRLVDFLADARHWCDRHGESFAELDCLAHRHYVAELHDE